MIVKLLMPVPDKMRFIALYHMALGTERVLLSCRDSFTVNTAVQTISCQLFVNSKALSSHSRCVICRGVDCPLISPSITVFTSRAVPASQVESVLSCRLRSAHLW